MGAMHGEAEGQPINGEASGDCASQNERACFREIRQTSGDELISKIHISKQNVEAFLFAE
jgi:hypothetical protein